MGTPFNNTECSPTGTCPIMTGGETNGTMFVAQYDPDAPVTRWHQRMELITICVCNSLTFIVIVARIWYRWTRKNRFRWDDRWMAIAGFFLLGYWASQLGTNHYGSGLHFVNVPEPWREGHWNFQTGWVGYYIITSCIKLSVCFCFIEILPNYLKKLRYSAYALCVLIASLGTTMTMAWLFGCKPFLSNFVWAIDSTECINYDNFRWMWVSLSVFIDVVLMVIPLQILNKARLRDHEKRILKLVFCATLLGTLTCIAGIYGVWNTRINVGNDAFYHATPFIMMSDIEIFMYALGASFPVLSRYLVQKVSAKNRVSHENFSSWARYVPSFFMTSPDRASGGTVSENNRDDALEGPNSVKSLHQSETTDPTIGHESYKGYLDTDLQGESSQSSPIEGQHDLEKGHYIHSEVNVRRATDESILKEYIKTTHVIGEGW